ncbi:hydroxyacid dehydrogenase [Petroclostridium sp. X23]|uniref:hydroxyacid dehydrogenase n=1 Tax=Petroclostridium sp. X23 TaxID=3045146 RepID=UPI0024ACC15F|nr:hydroxyacid dehydrogenase [Petroclostridium sp. X23]WHH57989.1 hydroxyacid dehydrogenase [Petroclostridium sp. X23]
MKFVMTQAVCPEGMVRLDGKADIIYIADDGDPNNYLHEMKDADAIIVRIAKCDRNVIESSPKLKVIGRTGVGYDSVDVDAATAAGVPIVITPGANNRSVAEHAVALMFAIAKNIVEGQMETEKGNFTVVRGAGKSFELLGKKVAFIGLGAIGRETAKICKGIGMKVLGYDPFLTKEAVEALGCTYYENYEDMMKECDFLSIHVPLTAETKDMIAKKQLETMKKTAVIINCSRGGIVNEKDLVGALNNNVIAGAGTDVFVTEPPKTDDPLLTAKNIVFSPHSAAQTREAVVNMAQMCVDGCLAVLKGEKWPYVANPEAYNHPRWKV